MKIDKVKSIKFQGVSISIDPPSLLEYEVADSKPELPFCKAGPAISRVISADKSGIKFQFHGEDISKLTVQLLNSEGDMVEALVDHTPTSNIIDFKFSKELSGGDYVLILSSSLCLFDQSKTPDLHPTATVKIEGTGEPEEPELPLCKKGPDLQAIKAFSPTSLEFVFDGQEISEILWKIHQGGVTIRTGKVAPKDNHPVVNFEALPVGEYKFRIEGSNCKNPKEAIDATFSIVGEEPEEPEIPFCKKGPDLKELKSVSKSAIKFLFDGDGVAEIKWEVLSQGFPVRSGKVTPTSNTPSVSFDDLDAGAYAFRIDGTKCRNQRGASVIDFKIEKDTIPEEPGEPSTDVGMIQQTDNRYIDIVTSPHPSGKGFLISDKAGYKAPDGYEHWYSIDGQEPIKGGELKNLHWLGEGIVSVTKHTYKKGLDTEFRWSNAGGGWYQSDAGHRPSFGGPRPTVGGQAFILLSRDHTVPAWKDANPAPQWSEKAPAMKLPEGKFMTFHARSTADKKQRYPANRKLRGETHFNTWGEWDDVQPVEKADHTIGMHHFGLTPETVRVKPNGEYDDTLEKLEQAGYSWEARGMSFLETAEGRCWMPATGPKFEALLRGRKRRYQEMGIFDKSAVGGAYGDLAFHGLSAQKADWDGPQILDKFKKFYSQPKEEIRPQVEVMASHGDLVNTMNTKYYGSIWERMGALLDIVFQMEISKRAGYKVVGYPSNAMEILDAGGYFEGAFNFENKLPKGGSIVSTHLPRPTWVEMFNFGFISMWFGDGFYLWDAGDYNGSNKEYPGNWGYGNESWNSYLKDGGVDPGEGPNKDGIPAITMHPYDALYSGAAFYNSFSETEGGARKYVSHSIGGEQIATQPDGSDTLMAFKNKKGIAQVREKDGKKTLMYFNPFLGNETKTLKVAGFKDHEITGNKIYCFRD